MPNDYEIEVIRPKLVSYQRAILESNARYTLTEASTKIGKTFSHLWWLFERAGKPPKPGANYWWIAPVYGQAEIAFTRLKRFLGGSSDFRVNLSKLYVETPCESFIHFKSAENPEALYGEDVYGAVFDEFTRAKEAAWIALRTTLTATKAPCKFIGNVKGKKNWGYKLGVKARAGEPNWEYFRFNAEDAIREGILDPEEIAQAKRDLPHDAFMELYMAEALNDQSNPFGMDYIKKAVSVPRGTSICYGVDLAKSVDWTVVTGLDSEGRVASFDRWQSDWGQTKRRIKEIVGGYPALVDSTGIGDAIVEDLQKDGSYEGYVFTSKSKQILMEGLAAAIQGGTVTILPGVMQDELESFEFEYSRTGVKYSAPAGMHDDCVCSLALAVHNFSKNSFSGPYVQPRSRQ